MTDISKFKVAVTGPESTGKSALSQHLAQHFLEPFAPEFAREYLTKTNGRYSFADLDEICRGQINNEERACAASSGIFFTDTDITVLKIWSQFRFHKISPLILHAQKTQNYHLHLLCQTDLDWYPDQLRESPNQDERDLLFQLYVQELESIGAHYFIISGKGEERFQNTVEVVENAYQKFRQP